MNGGDDTAGSMQGRCIDQYSDQGYHNTGRDLSIGVVSGGLHGQLQYDSLIDPLVLGLTSVGVDIARAMVGVDVVEIVAGDDRIVVKSLDIPCRIAQRAYHQFVLGYHGEDDEVRGVGLLQ